jgi:putative transposase
VQYASGEYVTRLESAGARISMAAVGNPYENAKAESFFRTLKMDEVYLKDYRTFEEAEQNIGEFIEEVLQREEIAPKSGLQPAGRIRGQVRPEGRSVDYGYWPEDGIHTKTFLDEDVLDGRGTHQYPF